MKVKVLNPFRDKDNFLKEYLPGTIIEVDEERSEHLLSLNLVEAFEEAPVEAKEEETVAEETAKEEEAVAVEKKVRKPRKVEV